MVVSLSAKDDIRFISSVFVVVKSTLFTITQLVLQQYDTSSQLLFTSPYVPRLLNYTLSRLLVWDAVFFIKIAQRGYVFEQEWAWGWLWMGSIRVVGDWFVLPVLTLLYPALSEGEYDELGNKVGSIYGYAIAALIIAHVGHYLAVVMLYFTSRTIEQHIRSKSSDDTKLPGNGSQSVFPLVSALLYVITPGGIFMSAGYAESLFAFCSFVGIYFRECEQHILAGLAFLVCCCLRGNGVLWGIVFLNDLFEVAKVGNWKKSIAVIVGGSLVGIGFLAGQIYAYLVYCPGREWCNNTVPLIYGYVQSHYWNVGFLNYWRTWQIPNFFFAFPTWFMFYRSYQKYRSVPHLRPYVIIEMTMLVMSLFVWHVQIITRVGTCMPLVYWYVAERIFADAPEEAEEEKEEEENVVENRWSLKGIMNRVRADFRRHEGLWAVRYMVTWIGVQAVLYASFIPPA
ncbi:hypothetical protein V1525DRAFT_361744 [Lipomyces kononenkoae]|uniref:Uncharacterized protein n=1 Tax=Lipomyces kononenkoae TaxID=34357 RepID=A0ACC3T1L7_LIPKO